MKKTILSGVALCALVISSDSALANKHRSGISLGLQGGYISHSGNLNSTTVNVGTRSTDISGNNGTIGAFLGYDLALGSNLFTGLEVFFQYQNAKSASKVWTGGGDLNTTANMKESYGADLKFGMHHNQLTSFIKLGVVNTKFELSGEDTATPAIGKFSTSPRKTGFRAGLGADYAVAKNWSIGAEWIYTWYGSISVSSTRDIYKLSYKPRTNNVNLRLKYTW